MNSSSKSTHWVMSLLIIMLVSTSAFAQGALQEYSKGKIFLRSGMVVEGENLKIFAEAATIEINSGMQQFALSDVTQIMAKRGKNKTYGKNCAGACAGFYIGAFLLSGGQGTDPSTGETTELTLGNYIAEMALWTGISYGLGYFIGNIADDWEVVYFKP